MRDAPQRSMSLGGGWRKGSRKVSRRRHLRREIRECDSPADGLWGLHISEALQIHTFNLNKAFALWFSFSFSEELFQAFSTFLRFPPVPPFSSSLSASTLPRILEIIKSEFLQLLAILVTNWPASDSLLLPHAPEPCPPPLEPGMINYPHCHIKTDQFSSYLTTFGFFFNRFIEIWFTSHTIYSFKMYN